MPLIPVCRRVRNISSDVPTITGGEVQGVRDDKEADPGDVGFQRDRLP